MLRTPLGAVLLLAIASSAAAEQILTEYMHLGNQLVAVVRCSARLRPLYYELWAPASQVNPTISRGFNPENAADCSSNTYAEIQIDGTRPATPNYAQLWLSRFPAPTGPIVSATIHVVTEYKRNNATGGSPIVETLVFNAQNTNELAASVVAIEDYGGDSDQTKAEHTVTFTASQFAYDFPNGASDIWVKSWMWHTLWQAFSQTIVYRVYDAWIEYTYP